MCNLSNAAALEAHGYDVTDLGNGWLEIHYWDDFASTGASLTLQLPDEPGAVASFLATHEHGDNDFGGDAWLTAPEWPAEFDVELGPTE